MNLSPSTPLTRRQSPALDYRRENKLAAKFLYAEVIPALSSKEKLECRKTQRPAVAAITWDKAHGFQIFTKDQWPAFLETLHAAECVVSYQCDILQHASLETAAAKDLPDTCDLLEAIASATGLSPSLESVVNATFGKAGPISDAPLAERWLKRKISLIRRLHECIMRFGHVWVTDEEGTSRKLLVTLGAGAIAARQTPTSRHGKHLVQKTPGLSPSLV